MCNTIPAFEGLKHKWEELKYTQPNTSHVVDEGLETLAEYREHIDKTPAYILAISESMSITIEGIRKLIFNLLIVLNPQMKLDWFEENMPDKVDDAKQLFIEAVSGFVLQV